VGTDLDSQHAQDFQQGISGAAQNQEYDQKIQELKETRQRLEEMKTTIEGYIDKIDDWLSTSQEDYQEEECCDFKEDTKPLLDEMIQWIGIGAQDAIDIIKRGEQNTVDVTNANKEINEWKNRESILTKYSSELENICGKECPGSGDCDCPDADEGCDEPECDKIHCNSGDQYYTCKPDEIGKRYEEVECKDEEGNEYSDSVKIHECECSCRPDTAFVRNVHDELVVIKGKLVNTQKEIDAMQQDIDKILASDQRLQDFRGKSSNLASKNGAGFDVVGNVRFNSVKYAFALSDYCNYPNPAKQVKDDGVCADWTTSFGLYGAQITAAATASYLTGGALASAMKYAVDFFPAVYDYEANYTISETLVDDKNRIMLHNIFAGDKDLYGYNVTPKLFTHVAPEFVIYKNRTVTASSSTLGRIFLYLYLPDLGGFVAIERGVQNDQCKGIKSDNSQCIYTFSC